MTAAIMPLYLPKRELIETGAVVCGADLEFQHNGSKPISKKSQSLYDSLVPFDNFLLACLTH